MVWYIIKLNSDSDAGVPAGGVRLLRHTLLPTKASSPRAQNRAKSPEAQRAGRKLAKGKRSLRSEAESASAALVSGGHLFSGRRRRNGSPGPLSLPSAGPEKPY